jgi:hypothetical protein
MLTTSLTDGHAASPVESLKALDWLNFFLAALLMGFGPDGHLLASEPS